MGSFVAKVRQPLPVLKDVNCTDNAQQILAGKCRISNFSQWIEWLASCCFFLFFTGALASSK